MDSQSLSTKLYLIATAERLFAERGINAISMRKIAADAGQRNDNAVQYHFGSKQGLVDAIFEHRQVPIDARRMALIGTFDREGRGGDPYAIAEAFVRPLAEPLDGTSSGSWYLRFCVQAAYSVHREVAALTLSDLEARPGARGLAVLRERAYRMLHDTLPEPLVAQRWWHFTGFLAHALADLEARRHAGGPYELGSAELFVAGLIDSAAAVLTAPCRPSTSRLARAEAGAAVRGG
ncbi:TetR/AcrR family transcriptional regulator [Streptomyces sp. NBC_00893]|uniref:TetR/AcrR family transcriptional regulator n=1 Tax=Streptomyces sp. NBC_00893 TaxID=2975862 RepID=UPI002258D8B4|nr:TetR/AcrR family transcriptional regulator [Streptomyces sp. NBC_00893]MCX4851966.1 TetR/AcrR family transcriptional regulator [Streptomyces sp. NBC_00893]